MNQNKNKEYYFFMQIYSIAIVSLFQPSRSSEKNVSRQTDSTVPLSDSQDTKCQYPNTCGKIHLELLNVKFEIYMMKYHIVISEISFWPKSGLF